MSGSVGRITLLILTCSFGILTVLEYGLRAYKSMQFDGLLYLASPSVNNVPHPKYGWISPPNTQTTRNSKCYGKGVVSYNTDGFRAPPLSEADNADFLVCILGDSTMQGYQIPDGLHFPYLLSEKLKEHFSLPYVFPLAVGGYGSLQEWMLYEDFCQKRKPNLIIYQWDGNDPTDNSYMAERYSGAASNNARLRPYFENGEIVYKRPYPFSLGDWFDGLMLGKVFHTFLLNQSKKDPEQLKSALEEGWKVAEYFSSKLAVETSDQFKYALVRSREERAISMFKKAGFEVIPYDMPEMLTCAPTDFHPTPNGHKLIFEKFWESFNSKLPLSRAR